MIAVMSSDGDTNVVLRGVTHGAVDFLIKPVRTEELRNVWQHVLRRRKELVRGHAVSSAVAFPSFGPRPGIPPGRARSITKAHVPVITPFLSFGGLEGGDVRHGLVCRVMFSSWSLVETRYAREAVLLRPCVAVDR